MTLWDHLARNESECVVGMRGRHLLKAELAYKNCEDVCSLGF